MHEINPWTLTSTQAGTVLFDVFDLHVGLIICVMEEDAADTDDDLIILYILVWC